MLINIFDTAIDSDNLGDQIIMDAVWDVVRPLFPGATFIRTPSHRRATLAEHRLGRQAVLSIVGGTNILKSHMLVRSNWRITPLDYMTWRNVVLLGVGWQQYSGRSDFLTKLFFNSVLSKTKLQSVRDWHTYDQLSPDVPNTIYTGCPTLWEMNAEKCQRVPVRKARHAVYAVTYYRPAPEQDRRVFEMLKRHYETIYFWPQQADDIPYVRSLGLEGLVPLKPDVAVYNKLLDEVDVDFVGGRLHGGIRAMQRGRRALIIPVDNRAIEMGKSANLPVISRDEPEAIERWINNPEPLRIVLPDEAIDRWKAQFTLEGSVSETNGIGRNAVGRKSQNLQPV
jgi:polysaccharide pyruvyl transferase WcaK-like protein